MSVSVLVKKQADNYFEWQFLGAPLDLNANGDAESLAQALPSDAVVSFIAPAETVGLSIQSFDENEKKVFAKTLPYTMEDDLVEDIEDLHFSFGEVENNSVPVAIVQQQLLQRWREELSAVGVEVHAIVPEQCLLPWQEGSWTLLLDGERVLLRNARYGGFAFERDTALLALQMLANESDTLPDSLLVFAEEGSRDSLLAEIPELLTANVQWGEGSYWEVLGEQLQQPASLNLLQGDYARSLPWRSWWQQWRMVAAIVIATVLLQLIFNYVELRSLQQQNLDLRVQIEQTYRQAIPSGKVVEPERQLRRQVNAMKGDDSAGFVALLDKMAPLLAGKEFELQSLNYNGKQSEVRLTILAPSFKDVESLRASIAASGLQAEMTGSNAVGDKTRARLRIKG